LMFTQVTHGFRKISQSNKPLRGSISGRMVVEQTNDHFGRDLHREEARQ